MNAGQHKVVQYLRTAYAQEMALVRTLQAHSGMAEDGEYKEALQHHLTETVGHARRVRERLGDLGYLQDEGMVHRAFGTFQVLLSQGLSLAKAPMDILRGKGNIPETMLLNARDEAATEAMEIATYIALEQVAKGVGDDDTAALAADIKKDEQAMLGRLGELMPKLAEGVIKSQVVDEPAAKAS